MTITAPAAADDAIAAKRFREGTEAYAKKDFRRAAAAFEAAFRESPHGTAAYNAGRAWEGAGEPARAADAYAQSLKNSGELSATQQKDAQTRLAALEQSLGRIEADAPAGATLTLGHHERVAPPLRTHLAPGAHTLRATFADGATATKDLTVVAGAAVSVRIEPPPAAPPPPPPPPETPAARTAGIVLLGASVAGAVTSIALGVAGLRARDAFDESGQRDAGLHDRAAALRIGTNIAWVTTGVLAATGITLVVISVDKPKAPPPVALRFGPLSAQVSGRF